MNDVGGLIRYRKRQDVVFNAVGIIAMCVGILALAVLLGDLAYDGLSRIDWQFLTSFPSRRADRAGILSAWVGSLCVTLVTLVSAVPLGVAAAIYLEEYAPKNAFTTLVEINIANLAGVPSIIYGLMALGMLVYGLGLPRSILVGGLTLGLLVLPIV